MLLAEEEGVDTPAHPVYVLADARYGLAASGQHRGCRRKKHKKYYLFHFSSGI
jgi:hypothetical protein